DISHKNFGMNKSNYAKLGRKVDSIIHCAAITSHYGNYDDFYKVNVLGTQEMIDFAIRYKIRLNHISTISVSGEYLVDDKDKEEMFTENDFYIGQNYLDNVYVRSKFEAESLVFKSMKEGLDATIFRMGNLTARYIDGQFQLNIAQNAFYNTIKSIIQLGAIPKDLLQQSIELSPIDCCSRAIVDIIHTEEARGRVFHIFNHNKIKIEDLICILNEKGIRVTKLSNEDFGKVVQDAAQNKVKQDALFGIINNMGFIDKTPYNILIIPKSEISQKYLSKVGFKWEPITEQYIGKLIEYMREVNFINKGVSEKC
ncbi:MAG: SDR family oxidoreductase, partial [Bacteroidota bacterium]|nr:SDR family oxidoreductase [Bacteroidota bacterium]